MPPRTRFQKKIDSVRWIGFTTSSTFLSVAAGTQAVLVTSAGIVPETLLRIRGNWACWPDGTGAPGRAAIITIGIAQVPEGTGTTVLWSPFTDPEAPWIYYDEVVLAQEEVVADNIAAQSVLSYRRMIDNKAMRKLRNREIQIVVENTTIAAALPVDIYVGGRMLFGAS